MSDSEKERVVFRREDSSKLAVRPPELIESVDSAARKIRSWLLIPGKLAFVDPAELRSVLSALVDGIEALLASSARTETIEQYQEPRAARVRETVCGMCRWCSGGVCHVDPPVIWRGENTYRFARPEVALDTPACSRWESRE